MGVWDIPFVPHFILSAQANKHQVEFYKRSGMHVVARLSPNAIVDPSWKGGKHADGRPDVYWMETDDNPPSVNGV